VRARGKKKRARQMYSRLSERTRQSCPPNHRASTQYAFNSGLIGLVSFIQPKFTITPTPSTAAHLLATASSVRYFERRAAMSPNDVTVPAAHRLEPKLGIRSLTPRATQR